jgi:hypothetical protein
MRKTLYLDIDRYADAPADAIARQTDGMGRQTNMG